MKRSPHPSQRGGREVGFRPRRRRTPSRNSLAESSEPLSKLGNVVSHAPVEAERLMRRLSIGVAVERMVFKVSSWVVRWRDLALERPLAAVFQCSCAQRGVPLRREAVRRLVSSVEAAKQEAPVVVGSGSPRPPCRTGRAMRGQSLVAPSILVLRRAGRKISAMAVSSGANA